MKLPLGETPAVHPSPSTDRETLSFYAEEAPTYLASGPGGVSRHLHDFLQLVPPGGKILELGCGGGMDSEEMIRLGFDVDPTDGVPEIASKAEKRLDRTVRILRFEELDDKETYDAVWANASLLHVPKTALLDVLARISAALKPGGHHFASYKSGGQEGRDEDGRYFNYLSRSQLVEAYTQSGNWNLLTIREYEGGGYRGRRGPWIAVTAQKELAQRKGR